MLIREILLGAVLLAGGALVAFGVYLIYEPVGYVVAGILLAAIGFLFLSETGDVNATVASPAHKRKR